MFLLRVWIDDAHNFQSLKHCLKYSRLTEYVGRGQTGGEGSPICPECVIKTTGLQTFSVSVELPDYPR